jgi:hypothetical protein
MHRRLVAFLLAAFLCAIGVNWPELPENARLADLIFIPLALLVLALPGPRWTWQWTDAMVAAYLLGAVPAILVSPDSRHSAIEWARELYVAVIYVIVAMAAGRGFARVIGSGLALGGAILAAAGLGFAVLQPAGAAHWPRVGEVMSLPYLGDTLRLRAFTATPAMLACVLTAAAPFAIVLCRSERIRMWCAAAIGMMVAAALTFSHAIAGVAVAVLIAAWPSLAAWPRLRRLAIAGVAIIVLAFNFAATASITSIAYGGADYADASRHQYGVDEQQAQIGGAAVAYNVMSYARIKQVAWRAFVEHPVAGIGLDRFHDATERAYAEGALTARYREIDPHSSLIGRLAECGLIGGATLLLLWLAWAAMARNLIAGGSAIGFAAAAALAGLIVSSLNADIMNFRFVWVLAGVLRGLQSVGGSAERIDTLEAPRPGPEVAAVAGQR